MATLLELARIAETQPGFGELQEKIKAATLIKAQAIADLPTPTQAQIEWAREALAAPVTVTKSVIPYVIAANEGLTVSQILGAGDSAIQTNVDDAVDKLFAV